jgi:predicted RNA-binding protein with PIN domain
VVTSDAATRDTVGSGTVSVLSSERFVADLVDTPDADTRLSDSGARRVPVARRIDEDVAVVLSRWARGGPPQQLQRP